MSKKILVIGKAASGKTYSLRDLDPKETFIINVIGKELPFRTAYKLYDKETKTGNMVKTHNSDAICGAMQKVSDELPHVKYLIIDDMQYIMSYEFMKRAREKGYDKWNEIALVMFNVLQKSENLREDLTVIFLGHSETETINGVQETKVKTCGKMLDSYIDVAGLFTTILYVKVEKSPTGLLERKFMTQSDGITCARSAPGMFEKVEETNLKVIIDKVNKYYEEGE